MKISVPNRIWDGRGELELEFPQAWKVRFCPPDGYKRPAATDKQIRKAFDEPIGTPPIRELARGRKQAVIIIDDITRPTPTDRLARYVLKELRQASIGDERIRFVVASGTHGALDNHALRKKLGQDLLERFPVYNHNPYENCVSVGATTLGTALAVNREVMSCDLKIGIGGILPHPQAGFGGGGKIILPGVAHIDSIDHFHHTILNSAPGIVGMGNWEQNPMRQETADAARLAGLDINIDVLFNGRCDVTDVLVGDPVLEHHEGVKLATKVYATKLSTGNDIVVSNAYAKAGEAAICAIIAVRSIKPEGGTIVMIMDCPEGQVIHYMLRSFGEGYGGRQFAPRGPLPPQFNLIVLNPLPDQTMTDLFADRRSVIVAKDWSEVMAHLRELHPDGAKVAVYPDGTAQYAPS